MNIPRRRKTPHAAPKGANSHDLVMVTSPGRGPIFRERIPAGTGDHDYLCGRCRAVILSHVARRFASDAVYECPSCKTLNAVAEERPQGRANDLWKDANCD